MRLSWQCPRAGLAPDLEAALARAVSAATPMDLEVMVVSGLRTLRRQAELMAAMTDQQLRDLYGRNGTPDYLLSILDHRASAPADAAMVYQILCQRREGFISAHLSGAAVDLAITPELAAHLGELRTCLEENGFGVLDETDAGIPCLHCRYRPAPLRELRA